MSDTNAPVVDAFEVFEKDQHIVYPLQGVGKINEIQERVFKGKKTLYYVIYLEVSDMTVMIPKEKAVELGIRSIVPKKEAEAAIKLISESYKPIPSDWKLRYQLNRDLLKDGTIKDIATVVRSLYHRSKVKELPILERKLFDNALRLFIDETSFSLNMSKDQVEELILSKLETDSPVESNEENDSDFDIDISDSDVETLDDDL